MDPLQCLAEEVNSPDGSHTPFLTTQPTFRSVFISSLTWMRENCALALQSRQDTILLQRTTCFGYDNLERSSIIYSSLSRNNCVSAIFTLSTKQPTCSGKICTKVGFRFSRASRHYSLLVKIFVQIWLCWIPLALCATLVMTLKATKPLGYPSSNSQLASTWNDSVTHPEAAQATKKLQLVPFGDSCINAYFEVRIDDAGQHGYVINIVHADHLMIYHIRYIAVGLGLAKFPVAKGQPGWRPGYLLLLTLSLSSSHSATQNRSYGYHGDDGR